MDDRSTLSGDDASLPDFFVRATRRGGVLVLSCRGDLDASTAPLLTEAITAQLDEAPVALIVDLSDLDFLASAGMSVLVEAQARAAALSKRFGVVANGPRTSRPLELVGLHEKLGLYRTLEAALATESS